uniref:BAR domain-containing protein n=1 Tax=Caenorhabditis japonica TaxID=281687 RepID=A0A8R1HY06_CAEJA
MFSRLKQKVKEKTGRAQATSIPADVETSITYFKSLGTRAKELHKCLNDLSEVCKWHKKANFLGPIENLGRLSEKVDMKPFEEATQIRIATEEETLRGLSLEVDKFKAYAQNEGKAQTDSINLVNRTRLNMDVAIGNLASNDTDANKIRVDTTTKEFEAACQKMRDLQNSINQVETNHSQWLEAVSNQMKITFKKTGKMEPTSKAEKSVAKSLIK